MSGKLCDAADTLLPKPVGAHDAARLNSMRDAPNDRRQELPPDLTVHVLERGSSTQIRLSGELDIGARATVEEAIVNAFELRPRRVVLNLSQLTFMDSSGVHIVTRASELADASGTELILIPGPSAIQRVFAIADAENAGVPLRWAQPRTHPRLDDPDPAGNAMEGREA